MKKTVYTPEEKRERRFMGMKIVSAILVILDMLFLASFPVLSVINSIGDGYVENADIPDIAVALFGLIFAIFIFFYFRFSLVLDSHIFFAPGLQLSFVGYLPSLAIILVSALVLVGIKLKKSFLLFPCIAAHAVLIVSYIVTLLRQGGYRGMGAVIFVMTVLYEAVVIAVLSATAVMLIKRKNPVSASREETAPEENAPEA